MIIGYIIEFQSAQTYCFIDFLGENTCITAESNSNYGFFTDTQYGFPPDGSNNEPPQQLNGVDVPSYYKSCCDNLLFKFWSPANSSFIGELQEGRVYDGSTNQYFNINYSICLFVTTPPPTSVELVYAKYNPKVYNNCETCLNDNPCPIYFKRCCPSDCQICEDCYEDCYFGLIFDNSNPFSPLDVSQYYVLETKEQGFICVQYIETDKDFYKIPVFNGVDFIVKNGNTWQIDERENCESCIELVPCTTTTTTSVPKVNECAVITLFPMGVECIATNPIDINSQNGVLQLRVTGGTSPYQYFIFMNGSETPIVTGSQGSGLGTPIQGLGVGTYETMVIDYYGDFTAKTTCELTVDVPQECTTYGTGFTMYLSGDTNEFTNETQYSVIFFENTGQSLNGKPIFYNIPYSWNIYWDGSYWILEIPNVSLIQLFDGDPPIGDIYFGDEKVGWTVCDNSGISLCTQFDTKTPSEIQTASLSFMFYTESLGIIYVFGDGKIIKYDTENSQWVLCSDLSCSIVYATYNNQNPTGIWVLTDIGAIIYNKIEVLNLGYCDFDKDCICVTFNNETEINDDIFYLNCDGNLESFTLLAGNTQNECVLNGNYFSNNDVVYGLRCDNCDENLTSFCVTIESCIQGLDKQGSCSVLSIHFVPNGNQFGYRKWISDYITINTVPTYGVNLYEIKYDSFYNRWNLSGTSIGVDTITNGVTTPSLNINDNYYPDLNSWVFPGQIGTNITAKIGECEGILPFVPLLLTLTTTIPPASDIRLSVSKNETICGCDGTITLFGIGGYPPYTYSINNGISYGSSPIFTNLCQGIYNVSVKDSFDNVASNTITLNLPKPVTTYSVSLNTTFVIVSQTSTSITRKYTTLVTVSPPLPDDVSIEFNLLHTNVLRSAPNETSASIMSDSTLTIDSMPIGITSSGTTTGTTLNTSPACQLTPIYVTSYTENWNSIIINNTTDLILETDTTVYQNENSQCYVGQTNESYFISNLKISGCGCCNVLNISS
jgi:hypothetical protein